MELSPEPRGRRRVRGKNKVNTGSPFYVAPVQKATSGELRARNLRHYYALAVEVLWLFDENPDTYRIAHSSCRYRGIEGLLYGEK